MSKKFKQRVLLLQGILVAIFLNILVVQAATGSLGINGGSSQNVGKTFTLDIAVASNSGSIVSIGGNVTVDDTSCVRLTKLDYVDDSADAQDTTFNFLSTRGKNGNFTLVRGTFVAGSTPCSTNVRIANGTMAFTDSTSLKNLTASKTITITEPVVNPPAKSGNADLRSLTPSVGVLSPTFASLTSAYSLEVDSSVTVVNFNAVVSDSKAKVTSGTTCNLTGDSTVCKISVTAENGGVKTYQVTVKKKKKEDPVVPDEPVVVKSSDANLSSLSISGHSFSPNFNKNTTSYSMTVENSVNSLDVSAIASDSKAKVEISGNTNLKDGMNTITITVTAEDSSKKIYTVNVTRKAKETKTDTTTAAAPKKLSSDNYLSTLIINNGELSPKFNKNTSSYNITIPNDVNKLDIKALTNNKNAKVKIEGNDNLKVGLNVVTIEVIAEDGSIRYYTVNVTKSEKKSNNKLKELKVDGHELSPKFSAGVFDYNIKVGSDVNDINITALADNPNAKVEISGNKDLKEGNNIVLVKVTDEEGFVQYYTINVEKEPQKEATFLGLTWKNWLMVSISALILGLLLLIIAMLKRRKYKLANNSQTEITEHKAPVIEFKPEFNFSSKNGTDDDVVEEGGVLNQYTGIAPNNADKKFVEEAEYFSKPENQKEIPYDPFDETVTKDEIVDAIHEALNTKDPAKLEMLLEQDKLNKKKKEIKAKERRRKSYYE